MAKRTGFKSFDLSGNLRLARASAEMTQEELSISSGVGKRNLQEYEAGVKSPTVRTLEKIAKAFDIPAAELLR